MAVVVAVVVDEVVAASLPAASTVVGAVEVEVLILQNWFCGTADTRS